MLESNIHEIKEYLIRFDKLLMSLSSYDIMFKESVKLFESANSRNDYDLKNAMERQMRSLGFDITRMEQELESFDMGIIDNCKRILNLFEEYKHNKVQLELLKDLTEEKLEFTPAALKAREEFQEINEALEVMRKKPIVQIIDEFNRLTERQRELMPHLNETHKEIDTDVFKKLNELIEKQAILKIDLEEEIKSISNIGNIVIEEENVEIPEALIISPDNIIVKVEKPKESVIEQLIQIRPEIAVIILSIVVATSVWIGFTRGIDYLNNRTQPTVQPLTVQINALIPKPIEDLIDVPIKEEVKEEIIEDNPVPLHGEEYSEEELSDPEMNIDWPEFEDAPPAVPESVPAIDEESTLGIGSFVEIKEGARIFKDTYSARDNSNPYKLYFPVDSEREIVGECYDLNGKIHSIYARTENYLEKRAELLEQGAIVVSYLTTVLGVEDGSYEGFFRPEDIILIPMIVQEAGKGL